MKQKYQIEETRMDGLKLIYPFYASDNRGYFLKIFEKKPFQEKGIEFELFEEIITYSHKGVIRGMHFQAEKAQEKYVTVPYGCIYDVVVDLRKNSKTFGQWKSFELSEENKLGLYIPKGFAHGFSVLSDPGAKVHYCCGAEYFPESENGILWNDSDLNIKWQGNLENPIISERDSNLLSFQEFKKIYGSL